MADEVEHRLDRGIAEQRQPFALGRVGVAVAIFGREQRADRLQIIARVEAFGNLADVLAERLAVAEVHRAGERIDLRAGVVDIIFLGDAEARRFEQAREAVADHRAAAMAHVQRPGRVGRDIFDIDPLVAADGREAVFVALAEDGAELVAPGVGRQPEVDEAGPGDLDRRHRRKRLELRLDRLGERARVGPGGLGQHHRRVGREVAVRGIARRLDRHVLAVEAGGQRAFGDEIVEHSVEKCGILGVKARTSPRLLERARLAQRQPARHLCPDEDSVPALVYAEMVRLGERDRPHPRVQQARARIDLGARRP